MKKVLMMGGVLLLTGCAGYRATPLNTLSSGSSWLPWQRSDVAVVAYAFDEEDCKQYLDRDVLAKGYRPIQITIENKTDQEYSFSLNRITLPCAQAGEVAELVHTSTAGRAAGYGAAALFFWPFAIPAVVDGVRSAKANEALDLDFTAKAAKDQVIEAYSHVNMLMFVPEKCFKKVFKVTLINLKTEEPREFVVSTSVRH